MKHEEYRRLAILSIYEEITEEEADLVTRHLRDCSSCQSELEDLKEMQLFLDRHSEEVAEEVLHESRRQLMQHLSYEVERAPLGSPLGKSLLNAFQAFSNSFNPISAMSSAFLLLVGIFLGNLIFSPPRTEESTEVASYLSPEFSISQVRFEESEQPLGNEVSLSFLASRRFSLKGSVSDERIQRLLAHTLVNEQNAGSRLHALSLIGSQKASERHDEIEMALVSAMKADENPAVRQQALLALRNFPYSPVVQTALVEVLRTDTNVRVRIEAINSLEASLEEESPLPANLLQNLQERLEKDDNEYIRIRAQGVLERVSYENF